MGLRNLQEKLEKTIIYLLVSSLVSFSTSLSKADKSEKLEQSLLTMWYLISKAERVLEILKSMPNLKLCIS